MEFYIRCTSGKNPPHSRVVAETGEKGVQFYIELEDLDCLMLFAKKYGPIIVENESIEVYDEDREDHRYD